MRADVHGLALLLCVGGACSDDTSGDAETPMLSEEEGQTGVVADLVEARGDVRHRAARASTWARANEGLGLVAGDLVQTMADAHATVRFVDGKTIDLEPGTTLQIPEQPPEVRRLEHLSGRLVARVSGQDDHRMEVSLPPGTLVLDPRDAEDGQSLVAQLDVDEERTRIDLVEGRGTLRRDRGDELEVANASYVALDEEGSVLEEGVLGPPAAPLAPDDGASLRVRRQVELSWEPHPEADSYRVHLEPAGGDATIVEVNETKVALDLPTGSYRWTVRAYRDQRGYPRSAPRTFELEVDREPPPLTLASPRAGMTVAGSSVLVAGRTEPGARVEIDGQPATVRPDGRFRASHPVPRGLVNLVVRTVDDLGNERTMSRSVVRP